MELNFTLERSHLLEVAKLRVPTLEKKKRARVATYFSNAILNIGAIALVYVVLLVTFWIVNFIWSYQADGFSLLVGFIVGAALAILLIVLRARVLRKAREESFTQQPQHFILKVLPEFILLSRNGSSSCAGSHRRGHAA